MSINLKKLTQQFTKFLHPNQILKYSPLNKQEAYTLDWQ